MMSAAPMYEYTEMLCPNTNSEMRSVYTFCTYEYGDSRDASAFRYARFKNSWPTLTPRPMPIM